MGRILVVDDEPSLRELMRAALEPPHDVAEAGNAVEAIELWRTHDPDVVLLDVMLPGASGIDILRDIRADETLARTRVIVVSAWDAASDRERVEEQGIDGFISKPFLPEDLITMVERLLADGPP